MKIVVLKFGGTSVGTIKKIKKVAEIIANYKKKKYKVIVVSSAMSGVTNELIKKSIEISDNFSNSEHDVLVSSGEQVACSLIAGRLIHKGYKSRSWLSWQVPIVTVGTHKNSRINHINKTKIMKFLKEGGIPIITGFQGMNIEVDTVDGFQGQEKDIIYISFVRSNDRAAIGFLSDERRLNVAMNRAKMKLVMVGDLSTLSTNSLFRDLSEFIETEDFYKSAWEYMAH